MMALRKSLRRGSAWVNHSITFRARESMLLSNEDWAESKEQHLQILGLPAQAMEFLEPILAGMSVGLSALDEAAGRGSVEIGADKLLHLPPIRPLDEEVEPRKTREAVFKHIGHVHFVDSNRRPAGSGHIDFAPISAALKSINFTGYASAEAFPYPDPDQAAKLTMDAYLKYFG